MMLLGRASIIFSHFDAFLAPQQATFRGHMLGLSMVMHRNNGVAGRKVGVAPFTYVKGAQKTRKVVYLATTAPLRLA